MDPSWFIQCLCVVTPVSPFHPPLRLHYTTTADRARNGKDAAPVPLNEFFSRGVSLGKCEPLQWHPVERGNREHLFRQRFACLLCEDLIRYQLSKRHHTFRRPHAPQDTELQKGAAILTNALLLLLRTSEQRASGSERTTDPVYRQRSCI